MSSRNSVKQQVKVKSIPTGYMQSTVAVEQLSTLADQLSLHPQHVDINSIYDSFCSIVDEQLEVKIFNPRKTLIIAKCGGMII